MGNGVPAGNPIEFATSCSCHKISKNMPKTCCKPGDNVQLNFSLVLPSDTDTDTEPGRGCRYRYSSALDTVSLTGGSILYLHLHLHLHPNLGPAYANQSCNGISCGNTIHWMIYCQHTHGHGHGHARKQLSFWFSNFWFLPVCWRPFDCRQSNIMECHGLPNVQFQILLSMPCFSALPDLKLLKLCSVRTLRSFDWLSFSVIMAFLWPLLGWIQVKHRSKRKRNY